MDELTERHIDVLKALAMSDDNSMDPRDLPGADGTIAEYAALHDLLDLGFVKRVEDDFRYGITGSGIARLVEYGRSKNKRSLLRRVWNALRS